MSALQIVWFKRDLRIVDHRPLIEASKRGPVLPLYVVETRLWQQPDSSKRQWLFCRESLLDLQRALATLGQPLVLRSGYSWCCRLAGRRCTAASALAAALAKLLRFVSNLHFSKGVLHFVLGRDRNNPLRLPHCMIVGFEPQLSGHRRHQWVTIFVLLLTKIHYLKLECICISDGLQC